MYLVANQTLSSVNAREWLNSISRSHVQFIDEAHLETFGLMGRNPRLNLRRRIRTCNSTSPDSRGRLVNLSNLRGRLEEETEFALHPARPTFLNIPVAHVGVDLADRSWLANVT